jgi:hypothetical protein
MRGLSSSSSSCRCCCCCCCCCRLRWLWGCACYCLAASVPAAGVRPLLAQLPAPLPPPLAGEGSCFAGMGLGVLKGSAGRPLASLTHPHVHHSPPVSLVADLLQSWVGACPCRPAPTVQVGASCRHPAHLYLTQTPCTCNSTSCSSTIAISNVARLRLHDCCTHSNCRVAQPWLSCPSDSPQSEHAPQEACPAVPLPPPPIPPPPTHTCCRRTRLSAAAAAEVVHAAGHRRGCCGQLGTCPSVGPSNPPEAAC